MLSTDFKSFRYHQAAYLQVQAVNGLFEDERPASRLVVNLLAGSFNITETAVLKVPTDVLMTV